MNDSYGGRTFVYVSNSEDGTISVFRLERDKGTLQAVDTVPARKMVMAMACSPDRRYLYAAIRSEPYAVLTYLIHSDTGALTLLGSAALPESMPYISTDRTGRFLFSASFGGDLLAVNSIGPQGLVQNDVLQVVKTGRNAHAVLPDLSNRYVYSPNLGADQVLQLAFDERTGELLPIGKGSVEAAKGFGPRHLAFSPNGRFVYVLGELTAMVASYSIDRASGALSLSCSAAALGPEIQLEAGVARAPVGQGPAQVDDIPRIWAADIHVAPDGRHVYVSERTSSTISTLVADSETGALRYASNIKVESQPRGFRLDPRGRFAVVSGEKSEVLGLYAIDPEDGALCLLSRCPSGRGANWVEIVEYS